MRKKTALLVFLTLWAGMCFGIEKVVLTDGKDYERILAKNEVFLKYCVDFVFQPENDSVFFLDRHYSHIFWVKMSTGELIRTISSRGQGPGELYRPTCLAVKNKKIFVLDRGLNGVKIFDFTGKVISEFRLRRIISSWTRLDVNEKDEIFVGQIDSIDFNMVSVYDTAGNKIKSLIPYKDDKNLSKAISKKSRYQYRVRLDGEGNIFLLYFMLRKLGKYSPTGQLLWEKNIENEILEQFETKDTVKRGNGTLTIYKHIFSMEILENGNIVVGHAGGGSLFSKEGKLEKLILVEKKSPDREEPYFVNLSLFSIRNNRLLNILNFGKYIHLYKIQEAIK
jgi:hypothetical protein